MFYFPLPLERKIYLLIYHLKKLRGMGIDPKEIIQNVKKAIYVTIVFIMLFITAYIGKCFNS